MAKLTKAQDTAIEKVAKNGTFPVGTRVFFNLLDYLHAIEFQGNDRVCELTDAGRAYAIERGWLAAEAASVEPVLDYGVTEHYPIVNPQPAAAIPALPDSQFVDSGTHVRVDSELIDKNEIALGNWQATNDYARKLESELQAARAEIAALRGALAPFADLAINSAVDTYRVLGELRHNPDATVRAGYLTNEHIQSARDALARLETESAQS